MFQAKHFDIGEKQKQKIDNQEMNKMTDLMRRKKHNNKQFSPIRLLKKNKQTYKCN